MSFDAFLKTAWNDHAERTDEVADRLSAALPLLTAPENIAAAAAHFREIAQIRAGSPLFRLRTALLETLPADDARLTPPDGLLY